MAEARVVVQRCGCIALPEDVAQHLGMLPEAVLAAELDEQRQVVTLRLVEAAPAVAEGMPAACSVNP